MNPLRCTPGAPARDRRQSRTEEQHRPGLGYGRQLKIEIKTRPLMGKRFGRVHRNGVQLRIRARLGKEAMKPSQQDPGACEAARTRTAESCLENRGLCVLYQDVDEIVGPV